MAQQVQVSSRVIALKNLSTAYRAIYAVGILHIFIAIAAFGFMSREEGGAIVAVVVAVFGALYMFLGYRVQRKSTVALTVFASMMLLSIVLSMVSIATSGQGAAGIFLPMLLIKAVEPAFSALKELK
jgi:hypothetical protein